MEPHQAVVWAGGNKKGDPEEPPAWPRDELRGSFAQLDQ